MSVKLNKTEESILNSLPEEMRAKVQSSILEKKAAKAEAADEKRNQFKIVDYKTGTVGVYGLGRQFPVALHPAEWDRLIANIDLVKMHLEKK